MMGCPGNNHCWHETDWYIIEEHGPHCPVKSGVTVYVCCWCNSKQAGSPPRNVVLRGRTHIFADEPPGLAAPDADIPGETRRRGRRSERCESFS